MSVPYAVPGRTQGQLEIATFFQSNGATILDPDGPGPVWEVPIGNTGTLETLNFSNPPPMSPNMGARVMLSTPEAMT